MTTPDSWLRFAPQAGKTPTYVGERGGFVYDVPDIHTTRAQSKQPFRVQTLQHGVRIRGGFSLLSHQPCWVNSVSYLLRIFDRLRGEELVWTYAAHSNVLNPLMGGMRKDSSPVGMEDFVNRRVSTQGAGEILDSLLPKLTSLG